MPPTSNQRIISYRILPPRIRIIYPEGYNLSPTERYLNEVDKAMYSGSTPSDGARYSPDDVVSLVFANQLAEQGTRSYNLAHLITERRTLAAKHVADIQSRLDDLVARRPIPTYGMARERGERVTDLEKQIFDLERQKRDVQLGLWRDLLDLRRDVVDSRREYRSTYQRMAYLTGGFSGHE